MRDSEIQRLELTRRQLCDSLTRSAVALQKAADTFDRIALSLSERDSLDDDPLFARFCETLRRH